ncbi:glycosyltransferase [Candidatus Mycobacterium wuenschmannii]|uniref:Glycosyltransferase n=1 Tax=Candidatus Mycobacterium wuenschmannii TaxID=3027808 RepID=A0ABY8VYY9_9MYCO|nr:glycosyltransferase [Candidatus Mycobacterium wuenschmannii]WIM88004.1 glycosyltransferase [Candidatus Mycobacterium wuenschmannii]
MKRALRIAIVASNRYPIAQPFAGGLEAHVWHLTHSLVAAGHHVSLFAAPGSDPELDCTRLSVHELTLTRTAAHDESMPHATFMADHHAYLALMLDLARCPERFDVIHNHSLHYLPVALAPTVDAPMLVSLHTPPTPWLESAIAAGGGTSARFAAVSRHTARTWSSVLADVDVVPNGIATDQWPLGSGGDGLVWFGRLTAEKGPHLAIEAARKAGRRLVLAGPRSDRDFFDDAIAPRLSETVTYAGHLSQRELAGLVGAASAALVTPVWDEPYGLVVAEALACGTPVVAFARGGIPELVDDRCGRLIAAGDTSAMAAAVADAEAISRMDVRRCAEQRCSEQAMLLRYDAMYTQMIERHERRAALTARTSSD